jgi:cell division protein FtsB
MRTVWVVLILALLGLQYKLWLGDGNIHQWLKLEDKNKVQEDINKKLRIRNQALTAEVEDLKQGHHALEEKARSELGMVKSDESFYQLVE